MKTKNSKYPTNLLAVSCKRNVGRVLKQRMVLVDLLEQLMRPHGSACISRPRRAQRRVVALVVERLLDGVETCGEHGEHFFGAFVQRAFDQVVLGELES